MTKAATKDRALVIQEAVRAGYVIKLHPDGVLEAIPPAAMPSPPANAFDLLDMKR